MRALTAILLLALLGACGGDDPTIDTGGADEANGANQETDECVAEWDGFVAEWNNLSAQERDGWDERSYEETGSYNGWALFAAEHGYPETYEEHCGDN